MRLSRQKYHELRAGSLLDLQLESGTWDVYVLADRRSIFVVRDVSIIERNESWRTQKQAAFLLLSG